MASASSSEPKTDWTPPEANCDKCGAPASWADEYVFILLWKSCFFAFWQYASASVVLPEAASEILQALDSNSSQVILIEQIQMDTKLVVE